MLAAKQTERILGYATSSQEYIVAVKCSHSYLLPTLNEVGGDFSMQTEFEVVRESGEWETRAL